MYKTSLTSVTDEIEALLVAKFSARGRDLSAKMHHVGRRLPKNIRREMQYLIDAETRCANPKHAHLYDPARVVSAHAACLGYLEKVDKSAIRSRMKTSMITSIAVNMLVLILAVMVVISVLNG